MKKNYIYKSTCLLLALCISSSLYARSLNATPTPTSPIHSFQYKVVSFFSGLFGSIEISDKKVDNLNTESKSRFLTVTLDPAPSAITVSCVTDVPTMIYLGWNDGCDGLSGTVSGVDVISNQTCDNRYTITRTWTYTSLCDGDVDSVSQTITVDDQTAPVITGTPGNTTVSCSDDVPAADINAVTATDAC
ncbi:HYR-like domain-containing protein, partial [Aestuariivivens marinum]|uniref:HYR-like domain-containing protein n=1 Tax=Aestuariivivens marinum TaxID=2913555 RepID=UPI001F5751C1